jgi:uncharacterized membrane protein YfcA
MITDPVFYFFAVIAVLLAGISKGGFGSGAGIFATPLVALTLPIPQAAAILLPIICLMDLTGLVAYRRTFSREILKMTLAGGLAGVVVGTLSFRYLDDAWIRTMLGFIAVAFVLHRATRRAGTPPARPSVPRGLFWSTIAGYTSTIAHAGGPPLSIYLLPLKLDKAVMVGTSVVFFAITNFVKLIPYTWLGLFDRRNLLTSLVLLPLAPIGIATGVWLMRRLSETTFYRICYALLLVVGAKLLYDGLRGILG